MAFSTKEQEIIKYGQQNGKTSQEIQEAISNLRLGIIPQKKEPVAVLEPTLAQNISKDFTQRADRLAEIWARPTDTRTKLQQSLGQGAGGAANIIEQTAMAVPGVKQAVGVVGKGMELLQNTPVIQAIGNKLGSVPAIQDVVELYDTDPNFKDTVDGVANLARLGMDIQGVVDSAAFTKNVTSKLAQKANTLEMPRVDLGVDVTQKIEGVKTAFSRQNVPETFETSVQRLSEPKMSMQGKEVKSPLDKYNEYLAQEEKFKKDIKADTALSKVGEDIGNQYEKVISQRRAAGKTMAEEVKKIGSESTDISNSFAPLEQELKDNGLIFSKGKLKISGATKMGTQDIGSLEFYVNELNKLGTNPTVQQLDAFLSRVPSELDVYKAKNNITKTTNAERIIKGNLAEIRKQLTENPNPAFKAYAKARKDYADLTNFLDEGASFLGKKTQAGDYSKDASVAKSAVQSILNQGKKDWLLRLEDLTGYPAVDNSMIALQAMKDAGNFRGLSLLETLSSGGLPTTKAGVIDKAIGLGLEKGRSVFMGTPAEQTRRIIQENMRQKGLDGLDLQEIGTNSNKSKSNPISTTIPQSGVLSKVNDVANTDITKIPPKGGLALKKSVPTPEDLAQKYLNDPEMTQVIKDFAEKGRMYPEIEDMIKSAGLKNEDAFVKFRFAQEILDEQKIMKANMEKAKIAEVIKGKTPEELAEMIYEGKLPGKSSPDAGQTAYLADGEKNITLKTTSKSKEQGTEYFDIHSNGKKIGEIETLKDYFGKDDLHIQFIGIDKPSRGQGFSQKTIAEIIKKNPQAKTISAEPTNQKAYYAIKKILGEPEEISNDIRTLTEKEFIEQLPQVAKYINGELDSTSRGFVIWNRPSRAQLSEIWKKANNK